MVLSFRSLGSLPVRDASILFALSQFFMCPFSAMGNQNRKAIEREMSRAARVMGGDAVGYRRGC